MNRGALREIACAALLSLHVLVACSTSTRGEAGDFIARAQSANQNADHLLEKGDVSAARNALREAAEAKPPEDTSPDDARVVRQDLYARLSTLELGQGRPREAAERATEGLALGRASDVFTTNLLIARGRARERLDDARGASEDYHDALVVTEALLDESLEGSSRPHE